MDFEQENVTKGFEKEFKTGPKRNRQPGKIPPWLLIAAAGILTTGLIVSGQGGSARNGAARSALFPQPQAEDAELSELLAENAPGKKQTGEEKKKASLSDFFSGIFGSKPTVTPTPTAAVTATETPVPAAADGSASNSESASVVGKLTEGDSDDAPLFMEDDEPTKVPAPTESKPAEVTQQPTVKPTNIVLVPIKETGDAASAVPATQVTLQVMVGKNGEEDLSVYEDFSVYQPQKKWDDVPEADPQAADEAEVIGKNAAEQDPMGEKRDDPEDSITEANAVVKSAPETEISPNEIPSDSVPEAAAAEPEPTPEPEKEGNWFTRFIGSIFGAGPEPTAEPTPEVIISTIIPTAEPTKTPRPTDIPVQPTETAAVPQRLDTQVPTAVSKLTENDADDDPLYDDGTDHDDTRTDAPIRLTDVPSEKPAATEVSAEPESADDHTVVLQPTFIPTATSVPEELPETGAAGRMDTPALVLALAVLIAIVIVSRRLRRRG